MSSSNLMTKTIKTLKNEGIKSLSSKSKRYVTDKVIKLRKKYNNSFKDILFINGCLLPHPQRYRVDHQIEQLEAYGVSCEKVDYDKLDLDSVRFYRGFIFYRCPITPTVKDFIEQAKDNNKTVFYDIDDLVFDLEYTDQIEFVKNLSKEERDLYDDGVSRMGETLDLCEYGIASTDRIQTEMNKRLKEVVVNRNVASDDMLKYSEEALKEVDKDKNKIILGYLSGSITHNDDFKIIMQSIIEVLKKYDNVYLKIVGLLDLPKEMEEVREKVITSPFVDWKDLPKLIRSVDINLAPLEDTIFNEAKSENKWTEAALAKVPTIASNVGAFNSQIKNNNTGVLCKNNESEWTKELSKLIEDSSYREEIALNAYNEVMNHHTTLRTGKNIADFIKSKLRQNICFVLPSTNVSGGVMVAIKHGIILKKNGYDVTIIDIDTANKKKDAVVKHQDNYLFVIPKRKTEFLAHIDTIVATMWLTLDFVKKYYNCNHRKYLVQGREMDFYKYAEYNRTKSNATYNNVLDIEYITISKWCQKWLKEEFDVKAKYAPNGIDKSLFKYKNRTFDKKIKILIEGNNKDEYKNVDESFKIVDTLDKSKYEISYLSYEQKPKDWYYYDHFYQKMPYEKVSEIYEDNDILIKTSILESFSYPPLEMMATGGYVVVLPNDGNSEYLKDDYNCLMYKQGNIEEAKNKIEEICIYSKLREKLSNNAIKTVESRYWDNIENSIIELYK